MTIGDRSTDRMDASLLCVIYLPRRERRASPTAKHAAIADGNIFEVCDNARQFCPSDAHPFFDCSPACPKREDGFDCIDGFVQRESDRELILVEDYLACTGLQLSTSNREQP